MLRVALRVAAVLEVEWPALARDSIVGRGARDQRSDRLPPLRRTDPWAIETRVPRSSHE